MSTPPGSTATPADPSLITGHAKKIQGALYEAIGTVSSDPSWGTEGTKATEEGQKELDAVKAAAQSDRVWGKAESALGMVTGNQDTVSEGNMSAEQNEWKASLADGKLPSVSGERLKGKVESAVGMAEGDIEKQKSGNLQAEKAEWTSG